MGRNDNFKKPVTINSVTIKKMVIYGFAPSGSRQESPDGGFAIASNSADPLAIDKVLIPGMKPSVVHPDSPEGGIGLQLIKNGALPLMVDPWFNFSIGDRCSILLNDSDAEIVGETIQDSTPVRLRFDFPAALLRDGINRLRVRVTRLTQPIPETSGFRVLLFNTPRPGGEVTGGGDNLNLTLALPADVIANGIDAARAAQGVDLTLRYPSMREHDTITLDLDSRGKTHKVTAAQATAREVTLKLSTADFWQDNTKFAIRYRVTDQIDNSSGPLAIWSKTTYVDVHLKAPSLDLRPPKVLEAKESNGTVLNFEKDFYEAKFATVEVFYLGSERGQTVKVYCAGRNSTYGSEIQTVATAGQILRFQVPRLEIVDSKGSGMEVSYTVRLPGTTDEIPSRDLRMSITGQKHHLPEPTLSSDHRNLRVYYPSLEAPYTVRMALHGVVTRYGAEVPITQSSYTNLPVDSAWLTENRGKTVLFNFTLKRTDSTDPLIFSWCLRVAL